MMMNQDQQGNHLLRTTSTTISEEDMENNRSSTGGIKSKKVVFKSKKMRRLSLPTTSTTMSEVERLPQQTGNIMENSNRSIAGGMKSKIMRRLSLPATSTTISEVERLPQQTENIMENSNRSSAGGIKSKIIRRLSLTGGKKSKKNNSKKAEAAVEDTTDDDTTTIITSPISSSSLSSSSSADDVEAFHIHTSLFDRPMEASFFDSSRRRRRKRGVSFTSEEEVQKTISLEEYTQDEIAATWFTSSDYMEFRKSCAKQVTKMETGEKLRDVKYCSLGLERQTRLGYMTRKTTRLEAYDAVLSIQEDHLRRRKQQDDDESCHHDNSYDDDDDVEAIAFAYKQISSSSQLWATTVGMQIARDAEDIDDILLDEDKEVFCCDDNGGDSGGSWKKEGGGGGDFLDDSHRSRAHLRELNDRALKCRKSKRRNSFTVGKEPGCLSPRKVNGKGIPRNLFPKKFMTTRGTASGSMLLL